MTLMQIYSVFVLATFCFLAPQNSFAQGEPGNCNPAIENCEPQCPPELPNCNGGGEPAVDPQIQSFMDLAQICQPGDISRRQLNRMRLVIIIKVIFDVIEPQPARLLFRDLQECV